MTTLTTTMMTMTMTTTGDDNDDGYEGDTDTSDGDGDRASSAGIRQVWIASVCESSAGHTFTSGMTAGKTII